MADAEPKRVGHAPAIGATSVHIANGFGDPLPGLWHDDVLGTDDRGENP